MKPKIKKAK